MREACFCISADFSSSVPAATIQPFTTRYVGSDSILESSALVDKQSAKTHSYSGQVLPVTLMAKGKCTEFQYGTASGIQLQLDTKAQDLPLEIELT